MYLFHIVLLNSLKYTYNQTEQVEIMYMKINSGIPDVVLGHTLTSEWMDPLANLARRIAENTDYLNAVEKFLQRQ